jgi:peptide/nickel transport system substrate-binding protein
MEERYHMREYILFVICTCCLVPLSGCITEVPSDEKRDSITIAIDQDIMGFYPWTKSYELYTVLINRNIYNSLVEFDEIFRIHPCLAVSWNNPDDYTWRFNLRKNVTFHNGYVFSATDVKYTLDLIRLNNSIENQLHALVTGIDDVTILDNYTVEIRTLQPCPILLNLLTDIFIVSQQYMEQTLTRHPIGTGAYRLMNYTTNESITLQRYDKYWKKDVAELTHATFKIIRNLETSTQQLLEKQVDIAQINQQNIPSNSSSHITIKTIDNPTVVYISFDFRENKTSSSEKNPFADVQVRKAIYHAINIDEMIRNSSSRTNCSQFVIPLVFGYNPEIKRLPYDIDIAQRLLNESGYGNGFSVVFDYSSDVFSENIIEFIKQQLSKININITTNALPYTDFVQRLTTNNFSLYINCWTTGTGDSGEIYDYLIGTKNEDKNIGVYNVGFYSNSDVDRFGQNASVCMRETQRKQLLQDCFRIAMDDVAWIPLFTWKITYGISTDFQWTPRADQQILIEYIKNKG